MGPKRKTTKNIKETHLEPLLGKDFTSDVYHASLAEVHPPPQSDSYYEDEEEQTVNQFIDMGRRNPNAKGTGRWKLSNTRHKIALFYFGMRDGVLAEHISFIEKYLNAYFCLEVDVFYQYDAIDSSTCTFRLSGSEYDITLCKKQRKRTKGNDSTQGRIDVFSLFDVLVHEAREPYISVVGLFDCLLGELDANGDVCEVLGRACGDRVACISLPECGDLRVALCITTHELLHTIGFDHCNSFRCVMNATGEDYCLFLSPVNLRKLKIFHDKSSDMKFLSNRYQKLYDLLQEKKDSFHSDCEWLQRKMELLAILGYNVDNINMLERLKHSHYGMSLFGLNNLNS